MKRIIGLVQEVNVNREEGIITILVYVDGKIEPVKIRKKRFKETFPEGLHEAAEILVLKDSKGVLLSISPIKPNWVSPIEDEEASKIPQLPKHYDYHHDYA